MNAPARWVVLAADPMSEEGLRRLAEHPAMDLRVRPGLAGEELEAAVAEAHALLVRSSTKVTAALIERAPRLRVIGRAGSGVDNIDVAAATRRGVVVMNTPGGNSVAAAEHTFALLLSLVRSIPAAAAETAAGRWERKKYMGRQLEGKTLGLIGFGRIGREVARRARAFGMRVLIADPFVSEAVAGEHEARLVGREALIAEADVVSLHVPLTAETRHLIDAPALARMKPGAILINCARGGLVDEPALLEALDRGALFGAAIDVFEEEPPAFGALLRHPRVVATPHLGASTEEAQSSVAGQVADQVADYLLRGEVRGAVNMPGLSAEAYAQAKPYLELAERLGSLAGQIAEPPFARVEVRFRGDLAELPRGPVATAALVGLLRTAKGGAGVNYVNARLFAGEHGIRLEETAMEDAGDHTGLVELAVSGGSAACTVAGVVTARGRPRLARWEGLGLDAPAEGHVLALRNPDVPGVVGAIGTLLGDARINIAHIAWGRDPDTGDAVTLINLDAALGDTVLAAMRAHPHVRWVKPIRLPDPA